MIRYTSQHQIELFEFEHPFEVELDKNNRWVRPSKLLPWDRLVGIYSQSLSTDSGRYSIDGRLAVGALNIKHRLKLSDREVIETIRENIYLQYFVGFKKFTIRSAFDASLFVGLRKRMGVDKFDQMTVEIIQLSEEKKKHSARKTEDKTCPAYNESTDLEQQVEDYYRLHNFYPEVLLGDGIYLTRTNRKYLKEKGIRITGKALGRPSSNESYYQKALSRESI